MELPEDVIQLIREYSKPMTRPDWRTLHKMPYHLYKAECFKQAIYRWNKVPIGIPYKEVFSMWWYKYMYAPTFFPQN